MPRAGETMKTERREEQHKVGSSFSLVHTTTNVNEHLGQEQKCGTNVTLLPLAD